MRKSTAVASVPTWIVPLKYVSSPRSKSCSNPVENEVPKKVRRLGGLPEPSPQVNVLFQGRLRRHLMAPH